MLDNLLDIEVAYSLLRGGAQDNENDPIDINYEKLKTKIEVRSRRLGCCCMRGRMKIWSCCLLFRRSLTSLPRRLILLWTMSRTPTLKRTIPTRWKCKKWATRQRCSFFLCDSLLTLSPHFLILRPLDLQNTTRGGAPALPSFRRAAQQAAAVARLSHHQLCGYNVAGSPHRPARGSSGGFPKCWRPSVFSAPFSPFSLFLFVCFPPDGLHVRQRCVLCRHGVQECKLLSHLPVRTCGAPAAGWGGPRQHVSHITMKNLPKCAHLNKRTFGWFLLQAWTEKGLAHYKTTQRKTQC